MGAFKAISLNTEAGIGTDMSFGEDWLGWTIIVTILVTGIIIGMKVILEFPGLLDFKCFFKEKKPVDKADNERRYCQDLEGSIWFHEIPEKSCRIRKEEKYGQFELLSSEGEIRGRHEDDGGSVDSDKIVDTEQDEESDNEPSKAVNPETIVTIESYDNGQCLQFIPPRQPGLRQS